MSKENQIVKRLALKAIDMCQTRSKEIERYCWMVVHEYHHGVMPVEYDIRSIDENLYLTVLKISKTLIKQRVSD